ncbi:hypothetical protein [Zobellia laminariae]|uniref:hypothetical protein n=1 Tax=Zobellia laminariae TaxID=248906 RepID=UPI003EF09491
MADFFFYPLHMEKIAAFSHWVPANVLTTIYSNITPNWVMMYNDSLNVNVFLINGKEALEKFIQDLS